VWAHAEYVKLLRSLEDGIVFDLPRQTVKRYLLDKQGAAHTMWRFESPIDRVREGHVLRIELRAPARVRWTSDDWQTAHDVDTRDPGVGLFVADLPTAGLGAPACLRFTFYWVEAARWEQRDYCAIVTETRRFRRAIERVSRPGSWPQAEDPSVAADAAARLERSEEQLVASARTMSEGELGGDVLGASGRAATRP
jgi:hypothetical protein